MSIAIRKQGSYAWLVLCIAMLLAVPAKGYPGEWESMDGGEIIALAKEYAVTSASKQAELIQFLMDYYLANPSKAREVSCDTWKEVTWQLRDGLSPTARGDWAAGLRAAFASDAPDLLAMRVGEADDLAVALAVIDQGPLDALTVRWVEDGTSWKALEPMELTRLAESLRRARKEGEAARTKLATFVESEYLASTSSVTRLGPDQWRVLARCLRSELDDDSRSAWASKLKEAFAGDEQALASLDAAEASELSESIRLLGGNAIVGNWMEANHTASFAVAGEIVKVAEALSKAGESGRDGRLLLIDNINNDYMSSAEAVAELDCGQWRSLAASLGSDLSDEDYSKWASQLRTAYVADSSALNSLELAEALDLCKTLTLLRDSNAYGPLVDYTQANAPEVWQGLDAEWLNRTALGLAKAGEQGQSVRSELVDHIISDCLASRAAAFQLSRGTDHWKTIAYSLRNDASPDKLTQWAEKLRQIYTDDPDVLGSLSVHHAEQLAEALGILDSDEAGTFVAVWLQNSAIWEQVPAYRLVKLAQYAINANADRLDKRDLLAQLDDRWENEYSEHPFAWWRSRRIAHAWLGMRNRQRAQTWAKRAYDQAVAVPAAQDRADVDTLGAIANLMHDVHLVGRGRGYPDFAHALARLARNGQLYMDHRGKLSWTGWQRHKCAYLLGDSQSREVLEAELTDENGLPRVEVAKILSISYWFTKEYDEWYKTVEAKVDDPTLSDDARALWMVVRAYTESCRTYPHCRPIRGRVWLDKAFAQGDSDSVRMQALKEIQVYYRNAGLYQKGIDILQSVRSQFNSADQATIQTWQDSLGNAASQ